MAQRRAQVVRHRVRKSLQLAVGRLELGRALLHALLQFRFARAQFVQGRIQFRGALLDALVQVDVFDGIRNVPGKLLEQLHLLRVEIAGLRGPHAQGADGITPDDQRK